MMRLINNHYFFWLLISLPALPMIIGFATGLMHFEEIMEESGEFSAQFLTAAMVITPLMVLFPSQAGRAG